MIGGWRGRKPVSLPVIAKCRIQPAHRPREIACFLPSASLLNPQLRPRRRNALAPQQRVCHEPTTGNTNRNKQTITLPHSHSFGLDYILLAATRQPNTAQGKERSDAALG
jgi:hypothetical protein